jgi:hypothetical protein
MPFAPGQQKREMRVAGEQTTFQGLVDVLGEVEGQKYKASYPPVADALAEQEKARQAGDVTSELTWSLKSLGASGYSLVGEPLDNSRFDFKPQSIRETFEKVFGH